MKKSLCIGFYENAVSDHLFQQDRPDTPVAEPSGKHGHPGGEFELLPENYFAQLDLLAVFGRVAPLEVDLGCGDGGFIAQLAVRFPERNFLGIEKLGGRVLRGCKKASRLGVRNVRFLRIESSYAIQYLLPPGSVEVVHLLFPDPWPKRKHKRRRIVQPAFLESVHRVLAPRGLFRIATDQEKYFSAIRELIAPEMFLDVTSTPDEPFPVTAFERHFVAEGAPIYRLELRKVS
jgi:tRNA (guanine-N7-)-methyltransferase